MHRPATLASRGIAAGALVLAALGAPAGCTDRPPTALGRESASTLVVSEPVAVAPPASAPIAREASAGVSAGISYVSLPPGSFPSGTTASIRNVATGASLTLAVTDGGFDPVAIAAGVGDELAIEIRDLGGVVVASLSVKVPPRRPPKVVRVDPPQGKTDVPLNSRITVVFSEPVDAASLTTTTVQLSVNGQPVAGTVQRGVGGLTAEFIPAALLDPATEYRLVVTQGVRDQSGDALAEPVSIRFTTGNSVDASGPTMLVTPLALALPPGTQSTVTLTPARPGGFDGDVAFEAAGLPTGVNVTFDPVGTPRVTFAATVAVTGAVAPGDYPIIVRATAPGTEEQTAVLTLRVLSAAPVGNTTAHFCGKIVNVYGYAVQSPAFFAFQDGDGPWTAVVGSGDSYTFNIASGRGAFAYVIRSNEATWAYLHYGTQAELATMGQQLQCPPAVATPPVVTPPVATKTVYGRIAGLRGSERAWLVMGGLLGSPVPEPVTTFTLAAVTDAPVDLLALRYADSAGYRSANAGIIRRDQNPAPNSTMPVLDFESAEAFTTVRRKLTVNNAAGEQVRVIAEFRMARGGGLFLNFPPVPTSASNGQYVGVPNAYPGDVHALTVGTGSPYDDSFERQTTACFRDAVDKTLTLPPHIGPLAVSTAATTPGVRLRFQYTLQSELSRSVTIAHWQSGGPDASGRTVLLSVTPGYLGASSTLDITTPDFGTLSGWNTTWGIRAHVDTYVSLWASGWTGSGTLVPACGDGDVIMGASRFDGTIRP